RAEDEADEQIEQSRKQQRRNGERRRAQHSQALVLQLLTIRAQHALARHRAMPDIGCGARGAHEGSSSRVSSRKASASPARWISRSAICASVSSSLRTIGSASPTVSFVRPCSTTTACTPLHVLNDSGDSVLA